MSGTGDDPLFADPLEALRASDHRPLIERWRDRANDLSARADWGNYARRSMAVLGVVTLLVAVGWRLFVTSQPPVEDSLPIAQRSGELAATSSAAPTGEAIVATSSTAGVVAPAGVVVHVAGAVARPGLISGVEGWRVNDAIEAAGGALATADLNRINLAAPIADGHRIFVPQFGEVEPALVAPTNNTSAGSGAIVNLNVADGASLEELPGVGPATAEAIMAHRDQHGPFATVDALVAVSGIGPATLERLRDHVSVG